MENKKYRSFSFKPFNAIRIFVYGFFILLVLISASAKDFFIGLTYSLLVNTVILLLYFLASYTEVNKRGNSISVMKLYDSVQINNVKSVQTWWSYDFGIESPAINEGSHGNSAAISNKINCIMKLSSENEDIFLYEQIHLGSKFPNDHVYLHNQVIDKSKLFRIWDIDNCIQKLTLEPLIKSNHQK